MDELERVRELERLIQETLNGTASGLIPEDDEAERPVETELHDGLGFRLTGHQGRVVYDADTEADEEDEGQILTHEMVERARTQFIRGRQLGRVILPEARVMFPETDFTVATTEWRTITYPWTGTTGVDVGRPLEVQGLGGTTAEPPREEARTMETRTFRVGDRVRFLGPDDVVHGTPPIGDEGEVVIVGTRGNQRVVVRWSDGRQWNYGEAQTQPCRRMEALGRLDAGAEHIPRGVIPGMRAIVMSGLEVEILRLSPGWTARWDLRYVDGSRADYIGARRDQFTLIEEQEARMMNPREGMRRGSRVRYVGPEGEGEARDNPSYGEMGTVRSFVDTESFSIQWDGGRLWHYGRSEHEDYWQPECVEMADRPEAETVAPIPREIVVGSRVRSLMGFGEGVVTSIVEEHGSLTYNYQVDGDDAPHNGCGREHLELLAGPPVRDNEIRVGSRVRGRTSGQTGTVTRFSEGNEDDIWYRRDSTGHEVHTDRDDLELLAPSITLPTAAPTTTPPPFLWQVGDRFWHQRDGRTELTPGTNGLWIGRVVEVNESRARVRVASVADVEPRADQTTWYEGRGRGSRTLDRLVAIDFKIEEGRRVMVSTVGLMPELSTGERRSLVGWIKVALEDLGRDNPYPTGLNDKLAIVYLGKVRIVREGRWQDSSPYLKVGNAGNPEEGYTSMNHRLAITLALMGHLGEPSADLKEAAATAITRYLLGEYQELTKNTLVTGKTKVEGLAFSKDKIAARAKDGSWSLPTGEPVAVESGEWTVCEI